MVESAYAGQTDSQGCISHSVAEALGGSTSLNTSSNNNRKKLSKSGGTNKKSSKIKKILLHFGAGWNKKSNVKSRHTVDFNGYGIRCLQWVAQHQTQPGDYEVILIKNRRGVCDV